MYYHTPRLFLRAALLLLFCALLFTGASFPGAWAAQAKASGAQSAATSCPPEISYGSTGQWVRNAQAKLGILYQGGWFPNAPYNFYPFSDSKVYPLNPDGIFGIKTENATRDFQTAFHLSVDGIIGPQTWHALGGFC